MMGYLLDKGVISDFVKGEENNLKRQLPVVGGQENVQRQSS